ncbi:hypothetical protein HDU76_005570, partial [Blyttiomyces sp. JEL0837]
DIIDLDEVEDEEESDESEVIQTPKCKRKILSLEQSFVQSDIEEDDIPSQPVSPKRKTRSSARK